MDSLARRLALYLVALALLSCEKDPAPEPPVVFAAPSTSASAVSPSEGSPAATKISMKEYDKTASATLGTLPEGIGIKVGEPAPKASGTTLAGKAQPLAALYEKAPILLVFYRGGWCPFCNFQIRDLVKHQAEFEKRNVVPVLVSVDTPSREEQTRVAHDVPYPMLSDSDLGMHKAFNVLEELETTYVDRLKSKGKDLQAYSGQQHNTVAVPAMFLISTQGKVLFAHADKDYKVRPRVSDVFAKLDEALGGGG